MEVNLNYYSFSGDGIQIEFPLSFVPASATSILVVVGGQLQEAGVDYTITGQNIRFMVPPPIGASNVYVINLAETQHIMTVSDGTITAEKLASKQVLPNPELRQFSQTVTKLNNVTGTARIDLRQSSVFSYTLTKDTQFVFINPPDVNKNCGFKLFLDIGSTPGAITWPAAIKWPYGQAPELRTANESHLLVFETINAGQTWYGGLVMEAVK